MEFIRYIRDTLRGKLLLTAIYVALAFVLALYGHMQLMTSLVWYLYIAFMAGLVLCAYVGVISLRQAKTYKQAKLSLSLIMAPVMMIACLLWWGFKSLFG